MNNPEKSADKNTDIARSIWLAGLGAYGRALDEAVNRYEQASSKVSKDTPKLFKELVKRGLELENSTLRKVNDSELVKTTASIEDRLKRMRSNLGFGLTSNAQDLERIEQKLDLLMEKIDRLLATQIADGAAAGTRSVD